MTCDDATDRARDTNHTNPYTGEMLTVVYERDPAVIDSGWSDTMPVSMNATETGTMGDVDHTPYNGEGVSQAWERGHNDRVVSGDGYERGNAV